MGLLARELELGASNVGNPIVTSGVPSPEHPTSRAEAEGKILEIARRTVPPAAELTP